MKGRQCAESWIKHVTGDGLNHGDDGEARDNTYMAVLSKDTVFKKTDISTVPNGVKMPPKYCVVYTLDADQTFMFPYKQQNKSPATQRKEQQESLNRLVDGNRADTDRLKEDDDSLPPPTPLAPDPTTTCTTQTRPPSSIAY